VNAPPTDWAWPRLIDSLQRDITRLQDVVDEMRQDTIAARELHRRELDALIEQLRSMQSQLTPIVQARDGEAAAARSLKWSWLERLGWAGAVGLALIVWHYLTRHLQE
jgi:hypothetical protein